MLVAWIVCTLLAGRVLATGTLFADRLASATRRPRRFAWLAGLVATAVWPGVAIVVVRLADAVLARGWGFGGSGQPRYVPTIAVTVPRAVVPEWLDRPLVVLWGLASVVLLTRLAVFAYASSRWRRALPLVDLDGVSVRLARDAGPAVVGVRAMDVVIPVWVLSLEPALRRLVLRHETAHREARDIYLLWLAALLTALVPWNLLLWWQADRLRLAIEMDCDVRVLREDSCPAAYALYARLLLRIAQTPGRATLTSRLAPALAGRTSRLEHRLAALRPSQRPSPLWRAAYTLAAGGALVLASAIRAPALPRSLAPETPPMRFDSGRRVHAPLPNHVRPAPVAPPRFEPSATFSTRQAK